MNKEDLDHLEIYIVSTFAVGGGEIPRDSAGKIDVLRAMAIIMHWVGQHRVLSFPAWRGMMFKEHKEFDWSQCVVPPPTVGVKWDQEFDALAGASRG